MMAIFSISARTFLILSLFSFHSVSAEENKKNILFIAGPPSHGWNKHEFPAGCEVLSKALNESGLNLISHVSAGWPDEDLLEANIDAIVLYSDGNDNHVAQGKAELLNTLYDQGIHFAVLHYALEPGSTELGHFLEKSIGGYFEVNWSVNPVWKMTQPMIAQHPATRGVSSFELEDEWYYHMRFTKNDKAVTPLLQAHPPLDSIGEDGPRSGNPTIRDALVEKVPQTLAWTYTGKQGQRGFGFTGGHFHYNWNQPNFRKLVLNGIAWTAGLDLPPEGIDSTILPIVQHQTIEHAIALGDLEDTKRHITLDPKILNRPGRGSYTPLHQAILRKKYAIVSDLLVQGADPNIATQSKQTALHIAIGRSDKESCLAVIEAGADLSLKDNNGWTPIHLAAAKDKREIVTLLIDEGANLELLSDAGGTPLHEAAVSGSKELIQLLLDHGIDPSIVSQTGKTALDHAIEFKNEAAIEALANLP